MMDLKLSGFFQRYRLSKEAQVELEKLFAVYSESMAMEPTLHSRTLPALDETHGLPEPSAEVATSSSTNREHRPKSKVGKMAKTLPPTSARGGESWSETETKAEQRYAELELLGSGGMGRVVRVQDQQLQRVVAMKLLKSEWLQEPELVHRFLEEARATAQLQHPGIVPVYDLGKYPDGRYYFTMKEVKGRTLTDMIRLYHESQQGMGNESGGERLRLRGLIDTFRRVCETVAYAHSRDVFHRDLKPDNIMLGEHGEVLVLDWGLVKLAKSKTKTKQLATKAGVFETQAGVIQGTPAYMSPEQARGEQDKIGCRSDVYALGAILYQILSGRPPVEGKTVARILAQVVAGQIPSPGRMDEEIVSLAHTQWQEKHEQGQFTPALLLPAMLVQICDKAMSLVPEERYAHAGEMAKEIALWLEGAKQRERGLEVVELARARLPKIQNLREQATVLQYEAEYLLNRVEDWEAEEKKLPAWEKQEKAAQLLREAQLQELEAEQLLQGALTHAPDLIEAHLALSDIYRQIHQRAERVGDEELVVRTERRLQSHLEFLPADHTTRVAYTAYLKGDGALSLCTIPTQAEVQLFRYVRKHRRMVLVLERSLGTTPLCHLSLPLGSYLLVVQKPGHENVLYPVSIGRMEHWDGIRPHDKEPEPLVLPQAGQLRPEECYVPGGWYQAGGDEKARGSFAKQQVWVDSFWIQRFPVTHRDYLLYLQDLIQQGREEEALRVAPKRRSGDVDSIIYERDAQGLFVLPTAKNYPMLPEQPVVWVSWFDAKAYAQWYSEHTGESWRLASEIEWEKAARGVDGRLYPWGNSTDPSYSCMSQSHRGEKHAHTVDSFPIDESPYGVRGMAGNVRNWCLDVYHPDGPEKKHQRFERELWLTTCAVEGDVQRVIRGGSWTDDANITRTAFRSWRRASFRCSYLGVRLVRT